MSDTRSAPHPSFAPSGARSTNENSHPRVPLRSPVGELRCTRGYRPAPRRGAKNPNLPRSESCVPPRRQIRIRGERTPFLPRPVTPIMMKVREPTPNARTGVETPKLERPEGASDCSHGWSGTAAQPPGAEPVESGSSYLFRTEGAKEIFRSLSQKREQHPRLFCVVAQ